MAWSPKLFIDDGAHHYEDVGGDDGALFLHPCESAGASVAAGSSAMILMRSEPFSTRQSRNRSASAGSLTPDSFGKPIISISSASRRLEAADPALRIVGSSSSARNCSTSESGCVPNSTTVVETRIQCRDQSFAFAEVDVGVDESGDQESCGFNIRFGHGTDRGDRVRELDVDEFFVFRMVRIDYVDIAQSSHDATVVLSPEFGSARLLKVAAVSRHVTHPTLCFHEVHTIRTDCHISGSSTPVSSSDTIPTGDAQPRRPWPHQNLVVMSVGVLWSP